MAVKKELSAPGDVDIEDLYIISAEGTHVFVLDYLVEFNIYEDIFSNFLTGDIVISDSANLIGSLPIQGKEYIVIKFTTPGMKDTVSKTFRIYSVTDRLVTNDRTTQLYTLNFCSQECLTDSITPLYHPFEGSIDSVVDKIFNEYISNKRTFTVSPSGSLSESKEKTQIKILTKTDNRVKFISPGWTPFKCINWLSSKAIPLNGESCNFLFWESNKNFYFGSLETIFANKASLNIGTYNYSIAGNLDTTNLQKRMFLIEDLVISKTSDAIKNNMQGYLSNRLISLDILNKSYYIKDYDHVDSFSKYSHLAKKNKEAPIFSSGEFRNPAAKTSVYPMNDNLFTNFKDNVNERMPDVYGNRLSHMIELSNFKLSITVPGRTDVEAGAVITINYPDSKPISENKKSRNNNDPVYSGDYIITAVRHKINPLRHTMVLEIVKDSLEVGE